MFKRMSEQYRQAEKGEEAYDKRNYSYVFNMRRSSGTKTGAPVCLPNSLVTHEGRISASELGEDETRVCSSRSPTVASPQLKVL